MDNRGEERQGNRECKETEGVKENKKKPDKLWEQERKHSGIILSTVTKKAAPEDAWVPFSPKIINYHLQNEF